MRKAILIFEKKFPKMSMEDYDVLVDCYSKTEAPFRQLDNTSMCRKIIEESVRIPIPGRIEAKRKFIDQAKEVADLYAIDTVVMEYEDHLTASFSVDCYENYTGLHGIIQLSDDISFRQDTDNMKFLLTLYTHATYLNGRRITPEQVDGTSER